MKPLWIVGLSLLLLLTACGDSDEDKDDTVSVDANQLVTQAAQTLDETQSFQLSLKVAGAPVTFNADQVNLDAQISLVGAEGNFVRPNQLGGTVQIAIDDVSTEVAMVVIGPDQYLKHPLITLNQWQQITFSQGFDATSLAEGDNNLASALRSIQNLEYVGKTEVDGLEMYHIKGQVDASKASAVTVGLIGVEGTIQLEAFIRTDNNQLEQLILVEPIGDQTTTWTIGLYGYNGEYTIERPVTEPE